MRLIGRSERGLLSLSLFLPSPLHFSHFQLFPRRIRIDSSFHFRSSLVSQTILSPRPLTLSSDSKLTHYRNINPDLKRLGRLRAMPPASAEDFIDIKQRVRMRYGLLSDHFIARPPAPARCMYSIDPIPLLTADVLESSLPISLPLSLPIDPIHPLLFD